MQQLTLGVMAHSRKENERRLPIHPGHLERIAPGLRAQIYPTSSTGTGRGSVSSTRSYAGSSPGYGHGRS
jgi:hypothetical protein